MMKKKRPIKQFSTRSTYFLIARDSEGVLQEFIGPIFQEEIDSSREEYDNDVALEILDELYFKTLYREEYNEDLYHNWPEYLRHFLITCGWKVEGSDPILPDVDEDEEFALVIKDTGVVYKYGGVLHLSFFITAEPHKCARLHSDISLYVRDTYDVEVQPSLYQCKDNRIFFGKQARMAQERDNLLNLCLN